MTNADWMIDAEKVEPMQASAMISGVCVLWAFWGHNT
jgi:hypothetical protein